VNHLINIWIYRK